MKKQIAISILTAVLPSSLSHGDPVVSPTAPPTPESAPDISSNSPYVIAPVFRKADGKSRILSLYQQLKAGQTRSEVEKILGKPLIGDNISSGSQQWYINETERKTFEGSPWGLGGICVYYDKENRLVSADFNHQYVQDAHIESYLKKHSKKAEQDGAE